MAFSLTACSNPAPAPTPAAIAWRQVDLGVRGKPVVRDVADCAGTWWVVGGRQDTAGETEPAAWTSRAGQTWTSVRFDPLPTSFYGPHDVIDSVACTAGRVAMIGAWPGGAHGIPRVSTWRLAGGRMVENAAPFETYGGDTAVDVGRVSAGPRGFAIAGNRTSGAAVWLSADGRAFQLFENAPGLAGDTFARDTVALPDGRWAVAGGAGDAVNEVAAVWVTSDGASWSRADPAAASGFNEIQRAVRQGDDVLAAGMRGTAFGLWRWHAGVWTTGESFGGDPGGVRSLAVAGDRTVLVGGGLWIDGRAARTPAPPVSAAARGDTLLMASDSGAWLSRT